MPSVELLFYMHNYQRRLCWTLSSICQQEGNIPELVINIASLPNNGKPSTEDVIDFFKDKLNIKHTLYGEHERYSFAQASYVKDRQIASSKCDWIFNPDADHVYAQDFFSTFLTDIIKHDKCGCCIGSKRRVTTNLSMTNTIINKTPLPYVEYAHKKAQEILRERTRWLTVGSHIAFKRDDFMKKCGGKYAIYHYDHHLFNLGMATRSDKRFRGRMGGTVTCQWPEYIHLNHVRDKTLGHHTEEQR